MRTLILTLFLFGLAYKAEAQSDMTLSEAEFMRIVRNFHPVAKVAGINVRMAEADVRAARGAFDPVLNGQAANKELGGVTYYNYRQAELRIPTWYGLEFSAGIEDVAGTQTDPQRTPATSTYAGVSFSVLKNIVIDKRRAALQQAKVAVELSENERLAVLNDLLYEAVSQYWTWVQLYREWRVVSEAVEVNKQRIEFTRTAIRVGERPAIDSVEAITQLQYFENLQSEIAMQMQNALLRLSSYTWTEENKPYDLPAALQPAEEEQPATAFKPEAPQQDAWLQTALQEHPDLLAYRFKFRILDIQKRLKFQELLPDVKVKYNQLGKGTQFDRTLFQPVLENNYQYGLSMSLPLRLSEARAEYSQARMKISQTTFQYEQKQLELSNKIREQVSTLAQMSRQISIQQELYRNLNLLLQGEETRFQNGESSLFLINSREQKRIESLQKLQAAQAKYYKQQAGLRWAAGVLWKEQ